MNGIGTLTTAPNTPPGAKALGRIFGAISPKILYLAIYRPYRPLGGLFLFFHNNYTPLQAARPRAALGAIVTGSTPRQLVLIVMNGIGTLTTAPNTPPGAKALGRIFGAISPKILYLAIYRPYRPLGGLFLFFHNNKAARYKLYRKIQFAPIPETP